MNVMPCYAVVCVSCYVCVTMNVACHDVNVMPFGVILLWYDLVTSCNCMDGSCRYAMNDSCYATDECIMWLCHDIVLWACHEYDML